VLATIYNFSCRGKSDIFIWTILGPDQGTGHLASMRPQQSQRINNDTGCEERERLVQAMPVKDITLTKDETFIGGL
jgi:hypothetical protein